MPHNRDLVRAQADNLSSDDWRKMFELLPNGFRFDLNQASGLELCWSSVFAFHFVTADTLES